MVGGHSRSVETRTLQVPTRADRVNHVVTVLVIEAGPFDRGEDSVLIPGAFFPVPYLWLPLQSAPQKALNGRSFNVPVGRVVGGGSVVNGMVFFRGGREEYADWAKLGAKGWDWDSLFPYFIKVSPPGKAVSLRTKLLNQVSRAKITRHQIKPLPRLLISRTPRVPMATTDQCKSHFPTFTLEEAVSSPWPISSWDTRL